jgi:arsenate reductase (thioredoxin)
MADRRSRILFLCTGNSCRSQMAEGFANFLGGECLEARSAGLEAHGKNPHAVAIMREAGIDISAQQSKLVTDELIGWADAVITVCGHADEYCPALPATVSKQHWPIPDPAKARGSEDEITATFRAVRNDIQRRVTQLVATLARDRNAG